MRELFSARLAYLESNLYDIRSCEMVGTVQELFLLFIIGATLDLPEVLLEEEIVKINTINTKSRYVIDKIRVAGVVKNKLRAQLEFI